MATPVLCAIAWRQRLTDADTRGCDLFMPGHANIAVIQPDNPNTFLRASRLYKMLPNKLGGIASTRVKGGMHAVYFASPKGARLVREAAARAWQEVTHLDICMESLHELVVHVHLPPSVVQVRFWPPFVFADISPSTTLCSSKLASCAGGRSSRTCRTGAAMRTSRRGASTGRRRAGRRAAVERPSQGCWCRTGGGGRGLDLLATIKGTWRLPVEWRPLPLLVDVWRAEPQVAPDRPGRTRRLRVMMGVKGLNHGARVAAPAMVFTQTAVT